MKKFFRFLTGITATVSCVLFINLAVLNSTIPDTFQSDRADTFQLAAYSSLVSIEAAENTTIPVQSATAQRIENNEEVTVKLAGIIPVKRVSVSQVQEVMVEPGGTPFGIKMFTKGVMVVGLSDVYGKTGVFNPGTAAGIQKGDIILSINGEGVSTNEDVSRIVEDTEGKPLLVEVSRDNSVFTAEITPVKDTTDRYKIGIWVRDSSAGIGTLTFSIADTNMFGGLGHGVCDVDTGELLPFQSGSIVDVSITGVVQGQRGIPGELNGYFVNGSKGKLYENTEMGVYGRFDNKVTETTKKVAVAMKQEVKRGKATLLTTLDGGEPKEYTLEIEKVNYDTQTPTKNMVIRITDPDLLEKTGGIIQGMSGSPILQDGKLIGAVTHVFINDPEKGYAIFAENMVKKCLEAEEENTQ